MNEIKVDVNFKNRTIYKTGADLTSGDYNSTKLVFNFDREDGTKIFEMKDPSDNLVLVTEIKNNEVILMGKDKLGKPASLFKEAGNYIFEVSLYNGDDKLTSASDRLKIKQEQVIIDGEPVESYLPIFDELLNDVRDSLNQVNNLNITATKEDTKTTIEITDKDGTTKTVEISDGKDGQVGPQGEPGINGKDGAPGKDGINGINGEDGFSPTVSTETIENGTKIIITDKEGTKEFNVLNGKDGEQGIPGNTGPEGPKGDSYTITESDYSAIADIVFSKMINAEEVLY